jgi:hypothetical protein
MFHFAEEVVSCGSQRQTLWCILIAGMLEDNCSLVKTFPAHKRRTGDCAVVFFLVRMLVYFCPMFVGKTAGSHNSQFHPSMCSCTLKFKFKL